MQSGGLAALATRRMKALGAVLGLASCYRTVTRVTGWTAQTTSAYVSAQEKILKEKPTGEALKQDDCIRLVAWGARLLKFKGDQHFSPEAKVALSRELEVRAPSTSKQGGSAQTGSDDRDNNRDSVGYDRIVLDGDSGDGDEDQGEGWEDNDASASGSRSRPASTPPEG